MSDLDKEIAGNSTSTTTLEEDAEADRRTQAAYDRVRGALIETGEEWAEPAMLFTFLARHPERREHYLLVTSDEPAAVVECVRFDMARQLGAVRDGEGMDMERAIVKVLVPRLGQKLRQRDVTAMAAAILALLPREGNDRG